MVSWTTHPLKTKSMIVFKCKIWLTELLMDIIQPYLPTVKQDPAKHIQLKDSLIIITITMSKPLV
jgi:hypothetical protein